MGDTNSTPSKHGDTIVILDGVRVRCKANGIEYPGQGLGTEVIKA